MKATTITGAEIAPLKIASLPSRPTAPTSFGGKGYSASEMKAAFDRLPLFIIDRLNLLLDDITGGDVLGSIPTGYNDTHTVADLIAEVKNGQMAAYLDVLGAPLTEVVQSMREAISRSESGDAETRALAESILKDLSQLETRFAEKTDSLDSRDEALMAEITLLKGESHEKIEEALEAANKASIRASVCEASILKMEAELSDLSDSVAELSNGYSEMDSKVGEISAALDELHAYAQALVTGGTTA